MSASICWRPVVETTNHLRNVWAPSSFISAMERAFGSLPLKISTEQIPLLEAMAAVHGNDDEKNPYKELIKVINSVGGQIEVWAEY